MNNNMEVANTILQQLGGAGRIKAMTGAKMFVGLHSSMTGLIDGVAFRFPNKAGANHVTIKLTAQDDYTVTFSRISGGKITEVETAEMVYAEDLKQLFERVTGLYLSF
jgi:hypothetical protein